MITKQTIEDGIYGVAIGDALGVPYEFRTRESIASVPCSGMIGYGVFNKPAGTWSDDTSMTLALADGLSEMVHDKDYGKIMDKFLAWLKDGAYTTDGVFDVGNTTMQAIFKHPKGIAPTECGGKNKWDNGNGSLMRIMPAVLYTLAKNGDIDAIFIGEMSALTHGHEISKIGCNIYAKVVKKIIESGEKAKEKLQELITVAVNEVLAENKEQGVYDRLKVVEFYSLPESEIKSSGYVVDTLEAALWCFGTTSNYKECVIKAVNLGRDTDTVAAVAGGLAGIYYGKATMPKAWVDTLLAKDMIDGLIEKLYEKIKQ